jgi:hypothetical protein
MTALSDQLIQKAIEKLGWSWQKSQQGTAVIFGADDTHGLALRIVGSVEGTENDILDLFITTDKYFVVNEWKRALLTVNDFNRKFRWPKAYAILPAEGSDKLDVVCEYQVECPDDITENTISSWIANALYGADKLYTMLVVDNKIPVALNY